MKQHLVIIFLSLLVACTGDSVVEDVNAIVSPAVNDLTKERLEKTKKVFHTIPSPIEIVDFFYTTGTVYKPELTNSAEHITNYTTNGEKALNLGVYGADLSYANVFDQSQMSMIYLNCSKKLSDELNVSSAFDISTIESIEENVNNRDSLMVIIDDVFWMIDEHLKKNGQDHLSVLITTGGWIEGLYLGTQLLDREHPNKELMKRIVTQKTSLSSLMALLITYDNVDVVTIEKEMNVLQLAYDKVDEELIDASVIFEIADAASQVREKIVH